MSRGSASLDDLDRRLVHALELDGRLPFSRIAAALGVSEQTIARRYRRLSDLGVVRIVAVENTWQSEDSLFLRIATLPGRASSIAEALAERQDVSWVGVALGESEVTCALHVSDPRVHRSLVAERLPRLTHVTGVTSLFILHKFALDPSTAWTGREASLSAPEIRALRDESGDQAEPPAVAELSEADRALVGQLREDGRRPVAALAAALDRSEGFVAKRLQALRVSGRLLVVTAVAAAPLGYPRTAMIWLTVPPDAIDAVGNELCGHAEVTFVGAVSGSANLVLTVACGDTADLYRYVTDQLGSISQIASTDVVVNRVVKRRGTALDGESAR